MSRQGGVQKVGLTWVATTRWDRQIQEAIDGVRMSETTRGWQETGIDRQRQVMMSGDNRRQSERTELFGDRQGEVGSKKQEAGDVAEDVGKVWSPALLHSLYKNSNCKCLDHQSLTLYTQSNSFT